MRNDKCNKKARLKSYGDDHSGTTCFSSLRCFITEVGSLKPIILEGWVFR